MQGLRAYDVLVAATELEIRSVDAENVGGAEWVVREAKGVPVFLVDDAVALYDNTFTGTVEFSGLPPIVVPFPKFWLEWNVRRSEGMPPAEYRYGVFGYTSQGRLLMKLFGTEWPSRRPIYFGDALVESDNNGVVAGLRATSDFVTSKLAGALYSLALLNCRNVTRREERLGRAVRRHPGIFAKTASDIHYTLDIPGAREFRQSVESAGEAQRKRLHIVRGHFADYSEGGGLFGKLHGRYYIAPHVRGSAEAGTVTKDYRVKVP